jgi:hypothetical protein
MAANNDDFEPNLLRLLCGQFWSLLSLTASREMFGKSYYSLSATEKQVVDQTVLNQIGANYAAMTPEFLKGADPKPPAGFRSEDQKEQKS